MLATVRQTIQQYRMLRRGDQVLVGVSGGPDSLALLTVLVALRDELRIRLYAAYVDHGLRPDEAEKEAKLVREMGRVWGVPVTLIRRKVRKSGGESLEAVARKVRYQALIALAVRNSCSKIALGHTRDDQAETVLMWILRGTGTTGLAGIPPVRRAEQRIQIVRPLIRCSRLEVEKYLRAHRVRALKDRSNDSLRFFRNRIRHQLVPLLEQQYNPQVLRHLAQMAEILREDRDCLEIQVMGLFRQAIRLGKDRIRLDRRRLTLAPPALRKGVLRKVVEKLQGNCHGFSMEHWNALDQLLREGTLKGIDLPHGFRAQVEGPSLLLFHLVH